MSVPPPAPPRNPVAGGALLAICPVAGALIGGFRHQATAGFLIGLGAAIAMAVAIWLLDRRR